MPKTTKMSFVLQGVIRETFFDCHWAAEGRVWMPYDMKKVELSCPVLRQSEDSGAFFELQTEDSDDNTYHATIIDSTMYMVKGKGMVVECVVEWGGSWVYIDDEGDEIIKDEDEPHWCHCEDGQCYIHECDE